MASLLDIAPIGSEVHGISVTGLSGRAIATLMLRFPEVQKIFVGQEPDIAAIMNLAPVALAAFIAAGTGTPNDLKAETIADSLPAGVQLDLVREIVKVTTPGGLGPFVRELFAMASGVQGEMESLNAVMPGSPVPDPSPAVTEALSKVRASRSGSPVQPLSNAATRRI